MQAVPLPSETSRFEPNPALTASDPARLTGRIAIVDDEATNIKVLRKYLQIAGYQDFVTTTVAGDSLSLIRRDKPDVVLLDVMMPEVSGLEILQSIRAIDETRHIPIIILTAATTDDTRRQALELGATDFLAKPVEVSELLPRVRNALVIKAHHDHLREYADRLREEVASRTRELTHTRQEVVHCLARAAEYRDNETGRHVLRVGKYVGVIAREMQVDPDFVELLELAAPLHDVGKIGIPDEVLRKPGKLTPDEFSLMQSHAGLGRKVFECISVQEWDVFRSHTEIGQKIFGSPQSPLLTLAARIALTHHERWDGSGYPLALSGENIPLEGRITAVADVFDALSSRRPYKPAFPLEKCLEIMKAERGRHFDPRVLDAFLNRLREVIAIQIEYADFD